MADYNAERSPEWNVIFGVAADHRLMGMVDEDGGNYPLVDALTPPGQSIAIGLNELTSLVDDVTIALDAAREKGSLSALSSMDDPWHPIETAPKTTAEKIHTIIITDGVCVPDIVSWRPERPARTENGTKYHAVPAGWFCVNGGRSRIDGRATHWMRLPNLPASGFQAKENTNAD